MLSLAHRRGGAVFAVGAGVAAGFFFLALRSAIVRTLAMGVAPALPIVLVVAAIGVLVHDRARPGQGPVVPPLASALAIPAATLGLLVVVVAAWASGRSHGAATGGLLPVSDAGAYFAGAERLLQEGVLDEWNSRRPLNAALFATRLVLAGGDFRGAMALQAVLMASAITAAARAVARDFGRGPGLLVFAALFAIGTVFVGTTLSESLGLSLGSFSFALLWHARRAPVPRERALQLAAGFAVCSMALNARSGPFFVLPAFLWVVVVERDGKWRLDRWSGAGALAGIAAGFVVNAMILRWLGGASHGAHSNFSYTLYGLALGGVGWERAFSDYPELKAMGDANAGAFIYARAMEQIRAHPGMLVVGLLRNLECFVLATSEKLSAGLVPESARLGGWLVAVPWIAGVVALARRAARFHGRDPAFRLAAAGALGALASVPIVYMDGRERVFVAALPFVVAYFAVALSTLGSAPVGAAAGAAEEHRAAWRRAAVAAALVTLAAFVCPKLGQHPYPQPDAVAFVPCGEGSVARYVIGRPGLPRIRLVDDPSVVPGGSDGALDVTAFRAAIGRDPNLGSPPYPKDDAALHEGDVMILAFDADARRVRPFVVADPARLGEPTHLCVAAAVAADDGAPIVRGAQP